MSKIINEKELIGLLSQSKSTLLIEPPYRTTYIPLGLAKISSFVKDNGGKVDFARATKPHKYDLICITSVFTNDADKIFKTIKECQQSLFTRNLPIVLGGVAATLLKDEFVEKFKNINVFCGYSKVLDEIKPDYSLDWGAKKEWQTDFSYVFTQRGCPNRCGYCAVKTIEPEIWINPYWKNAIDLNRPCVAVSDNNFLVANEQHIINVVSFLRDNKKQVVFNNGIYVKAITPENARLLKDLKYCKNGLRLAFDRIEEDEVYHRGCQYLLDAGIKLSGKSLTYILFNFNDTPQEAYYRAQEAWKYKSNPYLMQYRPLDARKKGEFVGKYWTANLIRAFKHWGELYGFNRGDKTFEGWMKNYKGPQLTKEDWEAWNYKK